MRFQPTSRDSNRVCAAPTKRALAHPGSTHGVPHLGHCLGWWWGGQKPTVTVSLLPTGALGRKLSKRGAWGTRREAQNLPATSLGRNTRAVSEPRAAWAAGPLQCATWGDAWPGRLLATGTSASPPWPGAAHGQGEASRWGPWKHRAHSHALPAALGRSSGTEPHSAQPERLAAWLAARVPGKVEKSTQG